MFRKEREYRILVTKDTSILVTCTKITKNEKGEIVSISFKEAITDKIIVYPIKDIEAFHHVIEPIDCSEFFTMYLNWNNFYKEGPHQNLQFAEVVGKSILESINQRDYVQYSTGTFADYDLTKLNYLKGIYHVEDIMATS